jgi:hypothetical protein
MNEPKLIEVTKTGEVGRKHCDHGEMGWQAGQLLS